MIRLINKTSKALVDLFLLSVAFWLAFLIRFDWELPLEMTKRAMFTWPYVVSLQYLTLVVFGIPRLAWRYIGLREAPRILAAISVGSAVLIAVRLIAGATLPRFGYSLYAVIPIGVIAADFVLAFFCVTGVRVLRRIVAEREETGRRHLDAGREKVRTMLIGAGQAGVMVAKEILARPDLGIEAIGFLDDDSHKVGTVIHGLQVLGATDRLAALCSKLGAKQALITIASAPGKDIRRLAMLCENAGVAVKIIPGIFEIVGGQVNLSRIRPVAIDDLLGREPVVLDTDAISGIVRGRSVLVTGAGGSIGSELCRQICRFEPERLILVEQAENNLFHIHRELLAAHPGLPIESPASPTSATRAGWQAIFADTEPTVVFHAAAHKHVPMMEWNPGEAVKNNVLGTRVVADRRRQLRGRARSS